MSDRLDFDMTYDDPIVAEIHENRRRILARFGNDIDTYMAFVASRRIPGVKYVDIRNNAQTDFVYPSLPSVPADSSLPCACESGDDGRPGPA